jgi:hypothetical protein
VVHNAARVTTLPSLGALAVDEVGNVWLGAYASPGDTLRAWWVVSPTGTVLGRLELPTGRARTLPGHREVLDVFADRLVLLRETDDGELYFEVRRFHISP